MISQKQRAQTLLRKQGCGSYQANVTCRLQASAVPVLTSDVAVALQSSYSQSAVAIRGGGDWRGAGDHAHHSDRRLRDALKHVDGLQDGWVVGGSHDDMLSADWRACSHTFSFISHTALEWAECLEFAYLGLPGALWEYLYSGTDASLLASCSWWS